MTDRLAEIKQRRAAVTPQPWEHRFGDKGNVHGVYFGPTTQQCIAPLVGGRGNFGAEEEHANAQFIAHAPSDIAWLIEEVERLRKITCEPAKSHRFSSMFEAES